MAKAQSFEQMVAELEEIIGVMEQGELPLEEMMQLYKKGVSLSESCRKKLHAAEQEISIKADQND